MNDYEEKKQARIDRYRERAERARAESDSLYHHADTMLSAIPPGQPMMPDHHSYQSDKRYRESIDRAMEHSIAASEKAAYYERKATAAENNTAISSDDPDALDKLKEKLETRKALQTRMKQINAYYRKHQTCRGCEGLTSEQAADLDASMANAYSWVTAPYPAYALSNNNAEIRRLEGRIQDLEHSRDTGYQGWQFMGGTVMVNADMNRLQIFFDEIPPEEVRTELKGRGFRWARSQGAWQRQLTDNAIYAASRIAAIQPIDGSDPRKIQPKRKHKNEQER